MPIFGGFVASAIASFMTFFGLQLGAKVALAAAFISVTGAAFLATKLAVFAVLSSLSVIAPPAIVSGISFCLPSNLAACFTALFLSDAILETFGFWNQKVVGAINILAK